MRPRPSTSEVRPFETGGPHGAGRAPSAPRRVAQGGGSADPGGLDSMIISLYTRA